MAVKDKSTPPKKKDGWMVRNSTFANVLNGIFLFAAGSTLAIFSNEIAEATKLALEILLTSKTREGTSTNWWIWAYWVGQTFTLIYLAFLVHAHARIEDKKIENQQIFLNKIDTGLKAVIRNAPNPIIFNKYLIAYYEILQIVLLMQKGKIENKENVQLYNDGFLSILKKICQLTADFEVKDQAEYCVNIMIYVHATQENKYLIKKLAEKNKIHFYSMSDWETLFVRGLLIGKKELIYTLPKRKREPVNIPILSDPHYNIPGAVMAVYEGENTVNTTVFLEKTDYDKLPKELWNQLDTFFSTEGKDIKSIVSFAIPQKDTLGSMRIFKQSTSSGKPEIQGVLNIDCNKQNIVGSEREFKETFMCFMWPLINLIGPAFHNYLDFLKNENYDILADIVDNLPE